MNPISHFLASWSVANSCDLTKKERVIVTVSGMLPDIDGLGIIFDHLGTHQGEQLDWWSKYHHIVGHNIGFGLLLIVAAFFLSTKRLLVGFLVVVCFHLHLLCDLVGSRGPDGYQWPIPYLLPFSAEWQWVWDGQWYLNAWPNILFTSFLICHMFYLAWRNKVSPLEFISEEANTKFVNTLRRRFGIPNGRAV